jgi:hypothetical protein
MRPASVLISVVNFSLYPRVLLFSPVGIALPNAPYPLSSIFCSYQKDERAKPGNLPQNIVISEVGEYLVEKYFTSSIFFQLCLFYLPAVGGCFVCSHTWTHTHSVGLSGTRDQPVPENSTWQNTTLTRNKLPFLRRDSYLQSQQESGHRTTP